MEKSNVLVLFGAFAIVSLVCGMSLTAVASPITLDEMQAWHDLWHLADWQPTEAKITNTNTYVMNLYNQMRGTRQTGKWTMYGPAGNTSSYTYTYTPSADHPQTFSFWITCYYMEAGDSLDIDVRYEVEPNFIDLYLTYTISGAQTNDVRLICNKMPISDRVTIYVSYTNSGASTDWIYWQAVIEET